MVPFSQLCTDSRQTISISRDAPVERMAAELIDLGYVFEVELLSTGGIEFGCGKPEDKEPIATELCENSEKSLLESIDRLVMLSYIRVAKLRNNGKPPLRVLQ